MRRAAVLVLCFILLGCGRQAPVAPTPTPHDEGAADSQFCDFALYLTDADVTPADLRGSTDLGQIPLVEPPLFTASDLVSYTVASHTFRLKSEAHVRVAELEFPMSGRAFVVKVGEEPIYAGAFWSPLSSQSFDGITIWTISGWGPVSEDGDFALRLGYPGGDFYEGPDPRSDPRVLRALGCALSSE